MRVSGVEMVPPGVPGHAEERFGVASWGDCPAFRSQGSLWKTKTPKHITSKPTLDLTGGGLR